jgi:hypothetical protein
MPYICEPDGTVRRVAPSVIRRKLRKGWIHPVPQLPGYFIRRGSAAEKAAGREAAQVHWATEQQRRRQLEIANARVNAELDAAEARHLEAEYRLYRAWRERLAAHRRELLKRRGLSPGVTLAALALPRRVKPPRLVAHGRGNRVVGAFAYPAPMEQPSTERTDP